MLTCWPVRFPCGTRTAPCRGRSRYAPRLPLRLRGPSCMESPRQTAMPDIWIGHPAGIMEVGATISRRGGVVRRASDNQANGATDYGRGGLRSSKISGRHGLVWSGEGRRLGEDTHAPPRPPGQAGQSCVNSRVAPSGSRKYTALIFPQPSPSRSNICGRE